MRTPLLLPALVGLALLPLAGCDSDGFEGELQPSSFTIADDGDTEMRSPAVYGRSRLGEGEAFVFSLGASSTEGTFTPEPVVSFSGLATALPGFGTYSLYDVAGEVERTGDPTPPGRVVGAYSVLERGDDEAVIYLSESGALRVIDSLDGGLRGSYTLHARAFTIRREGAGFAYEPTGDERTVSGAFWARHDELLLGGEGTRRLALRAAPR